MPLIIETYDKPFKIIAEKLFKHEKFTYLDVPTPETNENSFYYTRKELDSDRIAYYFSKIYFIESDKIIAIDKITQKIKYYDLGTGKPIKFDVNVLENNTKTVVSNLPYINAQEGELVLFPNNEEEDDD